MTRALFLTIPLLAACVHTPDPCDTLPPPIYRATPECVWRNGGLDMKSSPRPEGRPEVPEGKPEAPKGEPKAERPVDPKPDQGGSDQGEPEGPKGDKKPKKDKNSHSRDDNSSEDNGSSSDGNGDSSDDNGGKSDE